MQQPLQITFRGMDVSPAMQARIRELAARLEHFDPHIVTCHVTLERPHRQKQQGELFNVHIRMGTPGGEVVVTHTGSRDAICVDPFVALREAFDAAGRQLEDRVRRRDHRTRSHEAP